MFLFHVSLSYSIIMSLPDFPKHKKYIDSLINQLVRQGVNNEMSVFSESPRTMQHEGLKKSHQVEGGEIVRTDFQEFATEMIVKYDEIPKLTEDDVAERALKFGKDLGVQMARHSFGVLNEVTTKTGNVASAKGRPIGDVMLEMLEKMAPTFNPDGTYSQPSLVVNPETAKKLAEEDANTSDEDREEFERRRQEILRKKKDEWDAREANRKLVD